MKRLHEQLQQDLDRLEAQSMRRSLRPLPHSGPLVQADGRSLINLASNDYLGFSQHPHLKAAAARAAQELGTGSGASRLVTGHLDIHAATESRFAAFKHAPAALLLPTGYMANLAVLTALAGPGDLICQDKLNHASLIDAGRATGAEVRTYPHLNLEKMQRLLARHSERAEPGGDRPARRFIVTDAVFSMDGDVANLPAICNLAEQYDAIVVVDEAHATGVLGPTGAGLCEAQGVAERIDIVVSTASKGLGSLGGIVTSSQVVIDTLVNRARSLIYTTAIPPAQAAAIAAALDVVRDEPWRRQRVVQLAADVRHALAEQQWQMPTTALPTPILPLIVGTAERALALAGHLQQAGFLAVAIRPPTVPPGTARVRLTLRADLQDAHIDRLLAVLGEYRANNI